MKYCHQTLQVNPKVLIGKSFTTKLQKQPYDNVKNSTLPSNLKAITVIKFVQKYTLTGQMKKKVTWQRE